MSYKKCRKKIVRDVVEYAMYVVQVAELITPETRKELVNSIQKESQSLYRSVMRH